MLKKYRMPNGRTYQFHEKDVPDAAVEVKAEEPQNKAAKPENKARKAVKKK